KTRVPCLSVLTDPTMGGVAASFASLGDVLLAEPGALVGFAGPRVIEQTTHQKLPPGAQRSEFLLEHGMVDGVVHRRDLRQALGKVLRLHASGRGHPKSCGPVLDPPESRPLAERSPRVRPGAWATVQMARHPGRPSTRDYVDLL